MLVEFEPGQNQYQEASTVTTWPLRIYGCHKYNLVKAYELQQTARHPRNYRLLIIYPMGPGK